ncbi:porin family protein [Thermomonas flagellata]|uniref:porin family protein n=1 Tax=Thermomonas flagellata TaxID=2888524 RepID=UPI001F0412D8|nr:porin family protein [Thermomonas flagellata]
MKKSLMAAAALMLCGLSASATAGDGFVRAEVGQSKVKAILEDVGSSHDKDTAYSLRGGYWFNPNFAAEASYSHFYDRPLFKDGQGRADGKLSAIGLGMIAKEHATETDLGFFVQLRAGIARSKFSIRSTQGNDSETSNRPYYGIGAGYDFSKTFGVSLNYDHNRASVGALRLRTNTLSLGLEARF